MTENSFFYEKLIILSCHFMHDILFNAYSKEKEKKTREKKKYVRRVRQ